MVVPMRKQPTTEGLESLEDAAQRLLAKLNARERPAGERPAEIREIGTRPCVDEREGGSVTVRASLRVARLGGLKRGFKFQAQCANDNRADRARVFRRYASPVLFPDDNAAHLIARVVTLRECWEW